MLFSEFLTLQVSSEARDEKKEERDICLIVFKKKR